jgi:hypothetical protein
VKLPVDETIKSLLNDRLLHLENHFNADVISFYGPVLDGTEALFLRIIEELAADPQKHRLLYILLTTPGGSAIAVERHVNIVRHHYDEVHFVVPDYAYSAGTIFCMSGDSIHMDYFGVLGPIDPQVQNKEGKLVAALGYLDKVKELVEKAKKNDLTQAEFLILKELDLAELRGYEQAKELTIDLLKKWLVKYKFKNWTQHQSSPGLVGQAVTSAEKETRAEEIADILSNNNKWKSHGRPINIEALENDLKLKIDNYSGNVARRDLIRSYHFLLTDYIQKSGLKLFVHTRKFI